MTVTRVMTARVRSEHTPPEVLRANLPLVTVLLRYDPADPWALKMLIGAQAWEFARELLADALADEGLVGEGDVRILAWADTVKVILSSPSGTARLFFGRGDLEHALDDTEALVPLGAEGARFDFDREIGLLGRDAA
ncbi:SsgA family sporulation/cell division regulator [Amycolatopsis sp. NPDC059090]|uniref:SsgA family sporulation/cell division regulator n=1 Tax=unclassified Amycolatopsis TaxID=2618356 RepID=UPI00366D1568